MRNSPKTRRWENKQAGMVVHALERDSPAVHGEDHGGEHCHPAAYRWSCWSRYPHCSHGWHQARADGCALNELQTGEAMQEWVYPMQEWVYPKRLQPRKEPMLEARETWRKEAQRCYELITVLIPHPVLLFSVWKEGHRGARKEGVKLSLGRRG